MEEQRERARVGSGRDSSRQALRERAAAFAGGAGFSTDFVGYETTERDTTRRGGQLGQRLGAGQARRVAVLRHRRRSGRRLRLRRVRRRRLPRHGHRRAAARRRPGRRGQARARRAQARRARARPCRPAGAPRHRVQPHRHASAPRRAAADAGHARPPGRVLRRPRQAPLRLHARQRADGAASWPRSRTRSTPGSSRASRCGR